MNNNLRGISTIKERYIKEYGIKTWILNYGHEVCFKDGLSLDEIVSGMIKLRDKGLTNYFTIFEGHKLFTCDIDLERAYNEVYGVSKEEYMRVKVLKK